MEEFEEIRAYNENFESISGILRENGERVTEFDCAWGDSRELDALIISPGLMDMKAN